MDGRGKKHAYLVEKAEDESVAEFQQRIDLMNAIGKKELANQRNKKLHEIYQSMLRKALLEPDNFCTQRSKPPKHENDNPIQKFHEQLCEDLKNLSSEVEIDYAKLIHQEPFSSCCQNMLQDLYSDPDALYFFISNWLNIFDNSEELPKLGKLIETMLKETLFVEEIPWVHKLVCMHIYDIEEENAVSNSVNCYLQQNRNLPFWKAIGNDDIYAGLRTGRKADVLALLTAEKIKFKREHQTRMGQEAKMKQPPNQP